MNCAAETASGRPCKRRPLKGADFCHAHAGGGDVGRRCKLSDELERRLCDALRAGNYLDAAAEYSGVSRSSVHRWLAAGRAEGGDPRLAEFERNVRKALADAEVHAVGVVRKAMGGDWRAALAYLERRHPDGWARRSAPISQPEPEPDAGEIDLADPLTRELVSDLLRRRRGG